MKIVDRQTFLAMPTETLYAKYEPCAFEDPCIKGNTIYSEGRAIDWFYQQIVGSLRCSGSDEWVKLLDQSQNHGMSLSMDFEAQGRDGCFDQDQLFAVFEKPDVAALIKRLTLCGDHGSSK